VSEVTRLDRLLEKLERDVSAEAAREAEAVQKKIEGEAGKAAEAAAALATKHLSEIARLGRELLSAIAKADEKIRIAQLTRSPDLPPLQRTEDRFRSTPKLERKIISERTVERWVYASNGTILSKEIADKVIARDRQTGKVYYNGGGATSVSEVEKRNFRRIVFHPEVPGQAATPLAQALAVPGLTAIDPPIWEPILWADPAAVFAQLQTRSEGASTRLARQTNVEMIPLDPPKATDAAA
jgi:hypothetical protein